MKKIILLLIVCFSSCVVKQNNNDNFRLTKINAELKKKLEEILLKDQGIREILAGNLSDEKKEKLLIEMKISEQDIEGNKKFVLMREIDSTNLLEIESIVKKHGYPSKALVGEPANNAVFYVIQHSNKIDEYLPLIKKAAQNGDVDSTSLAMMEDRNLMYKGVEQIYGTQIKGKLNKKGEWIYFLWPIKNADSINKWRKNAGFKQTIEEYTKDMKVEFKKYKINDLNEM
jgi:hypothetical protein